MKPLSIYLHIPFCDTRCSYCAFNTYTSLAVLIPEYVVALATEIEITDPEIVHNHNIHTIYFGGGTPSILTIAQFSRLISILYQTFTIPKHVEITIEANPNDLTNSDWLRQLIGLGVGRLSIGMQTSNEAELRLFNRQHNLKSVQQAVKIARQVGFKNINLDLIFGFPGQNLESWNQSIKNALILEPEHISLYALGLESGTDLAYWVQQERYQMPQDNLIADMYDLASEVLHGESYIQYEISNWAKPGYECRHNLQYWRNDAYLGFGAGAHGYVNETRYEVIRNPKDYVERLRGYRNTDERDDEPRIYRYIAIKYEEEIKETLITNLRLLNEGINRTNFKERFGVDVLEIRPGVFEKYRDLALVEISSESIRLTPAGRLVSNAIFRELV